MDDRKVPDPGWQPCIGQGGEHREPPRQLRIFIDDYEDIAVKAFEARTGQLCKGLLRIAGDSPDVEAIEMHVALLVVAPVKPFPTAPRAAIMIDRGPNGEIFDRASGFDGLHANDALRILRAWNVEQERLTALLKMPQRRGILGDPDFITKTIEAYRTLESLYEHLSEDHEVRIRAQDVADYFGVKRPSFYRRLGDAGLTFSDIKRMAREEEEE